MYRDQLIIPTCGHTVSSRCMQQLITNSTSRGGAECSECCAHSPMTTNGFTRDHAGTSVQLAEKRLKRDKRAEDKARVRNFFIEKLKRQENPAQGDVTTRYAELKRAQREGAELLRKTREAEERRVRAEHEAALKAHHAGMSTDPSESATLKAKWKSTSDDLHGIFNKYGEILALLMGKKGHTALIEFAHAAASGGRDG